MKKLIKFLGLLLITGVIFAGCGSGVNGGAGSSDTAGGNSGSSAGTQGTNNTGTQTGNEANNIVTHVTLADGNWDMTYTSSFEYKSDQFDADVVSIYENQSDVVVAGDKMTILSGIHSQTYIYTFSESATQNYIDQSYEDLKQEVED